DPLLLTGALTNLIENAIDFSPPGGTVEIRIQRAGNHALVTVRDEGPGVPDYAAGRVFDRFYSLARPNNGKKGTGLGLAFVKEIGEVHRGSATLENVEGGALAILRLPLGSA